MALNYGSSTLGDKRNRTQQSKSLGDTFGEEINSIFADTQVVEQAQPNSDTKASGDRSPPAKRLATQEPVQERSDQAEPTTSKPCSDKHTGFSTASTAHNTSFDTINTMSDPNATNRFSKTAFAEETDHSLWIIKQQTDIVNGDLEKYFKQVISHDRLNALMASAKVPATLDIKRMLRTTTQLHTQDLDVNSMFQPEIDTAIDTAQSIILTVVEKAQAAAAAKLKAKIDQAPNIAALAAARPYRDVLTTTDIPIPLGMKETLEDNIALAEFTAKETVTQHIKSVTQQEEAAAAARREKAEQKLQRQSEQQQPQGSMPTTSSHDMETDDHAPMQADPDAGPSAQRGDGATPQRPAANTHTTTQQNTAANSGGSELETVKQYIDNRFDNMLNQVTTSVSAIVGAHMDIDRSRSSSPASTTDRDGWSTQRHGRDRSRSRNRSWRQADHGQCAQPTPPPPPPPPPRQQQQQQHYRTVEHSYGHNYGLRYSQGQGQHQAAAGPPAPPPAGPKNQQQRAAARHANGSGSGPVVNSSNGSWLGMAMHKQALPPPPASRTGLRY